MFFRCRQSRGRFVGFIARRFLNHYDEWYSCVRSKWKESEVRELDKQSYARTACGYLDRKYLNKLIIGGEMKMGMTQVGPPPDCSSVSIEKNNR